MSSMLSRHWREIFSTDTFTANVTCLDATEPVRAFMEDNPKAQWDWSDDFPCVVNPFKDFLWVEALTPKYSNEAGRIVPQAGHGGLVSRMAWLVYTLSLESVPVDVPLPDNAGAVFLRHDMPAEMRNVLRDADLPRPKWAQMVTTYTEVMGNQLGNIGAFFDYLDANGRWLASNAGNRPIVPHPATMGRLRAYYRDEAIATEHAVHLTGSTSMSLGYTLSLLHCKNVTVLDRLPLPKKSKPSEPRFTFKVLDLKPMREVVRGLKAEGDPNAIKRALHICRGHFATYKEDAPLFGKVTGTFWIPQHARGTIERGAVQKDYRIKS